MTPSKNERIKRVVLHVPVGVFNAWLMERNKCAGVTFAASFLGYEVIEHGRIKDGADIDLKGSNIGFAAYYIVRALWRWKKKGNHELENNKL